MDDEQAALIAACALLGSHDVGYATVLETAQSMLEILDKLRWEK